MNNLLMRMCTAAVLMLAFLVAMQAGMFAFLAYFAFFLAWAGIFEWPALTVSWPWIARYGIGALYLCFPLFILRVLYESYYPHDSIAVVYPVLAALVCDSAAYFVGKFWGKTYAFPVTSPRKTYEGLLAGYLAVIALHEFLRCMYPAGAGYLRVVTAFPVLSGIVVATVAVLGDLGVSALKRRVGLKDSGALFPGHGGALDRGGSLIFVVFVVGMLHALAH